MGGKVGEMSGKSDREVHGAGWTQPHGESLGTERVRAVDADLGTVEGGPVEGCNTQALPAARRYYKVMIRYYKVILSALP